MDAGPALLGPVGGVSLVVAAAGLAKLRRPASTAASLTGLGLPRPLRGRGAARLLGAAEVALGLAALATGHRAALVALAAACAGFVAVTAVLLRRPHVPCGCFGDDRAPASRGGLATDLVLLALAVGGIVAPPGPAHRALGDAPVTGAATLVSAALLAWLLVQLHALAPAERATGPAPMGAA